MTPPEFLHTHLVFTRAEFAAVLRVRGPRSSATITSHLQRWQRAGRLARVRRGVFVRLDPARSAARPLVDPQVLAGRLAPDAVLAYHTALEVHGFAQSMFERFTFATWTKAKPLDFQGCKYVPVRPRAPLRHAENSSRWTETVERGGLPVRVTTLERTVVDVFDRPDLAGGVEEVWRSCAAVPALDLREVERYALLLSGAVMLARLGYFLERRSDELMVPLALLERLGERRPKVPVYMERRRRGRLVPAWNLIVPPELLPNEEERNHEDSA